MAAAGGFSSLTDDQKALASKWFIVDKADRDTVHTDAEQILNGAEFHKRSVEARRQRELIAVSTIYNRLVKADADEVVDDTNDLVIKYVKRGREGTIEGDPEALFDYIDARVSTGYESTGLRAKNFTPLVGTIGDLADDIMDILKNGNY